MRRPERQPGIFLYQYGIMRALYMVHMAAGVS